MGAGQTVHTRAGNQDGKVRGRLEPHRHWWKLVHRERQELGHGAGGRLFTGTGKDDPEDERTIARITGRNCTMLQNAAAILQYSDS